MPSTWSTARHIIRSEGFGSKGLLKGITATLGRHGLFNAVYFGSYYNMKRFFVSPEVRLFLHGMTFSTKYVRRQVKAYPTLTTSHILIPSHVGEIHVNTTGKSLHEYGKCAMSAFTPSIHCAHTVLMSGVGPFIKRTSVSKMVPPRSLYSVRAEY